MSLKLADIRVDGGTQSRAAITEDTVAEYAEAMADPNTVFPPVVVYYDGREYWLADGFHRVEAWRRVGREEVPAEIRQGDRRRAILHSCGANAAHGLRRSNADKRRAVMTLLEDAEWGQWSARQIAKQCGVSADFVARMRRDQSGDVSSDDSEPRTYTTKHGTTAQMDTGNIGKRDPQPETGECQPDTEPAPVAPEDCQPAAPEPHAEARKGLSGLTREGLEDEVIGLREENAELRDKVKAVTVERDSLKSKLKEATSEDMGRALGNAQRQRDTLSGRVNELLAANKRMEYRVKKAEAERDEALRSMEAQEVRLC